MRSGIWRFMGTETTLMWGKEKQSHSWNRALRGRAPSAVRQRFTWVLWHRAAEPKLERCKSAPFLDTVGQRTAPYLGAARQHCEAAW
jgi:hypothetical protein